MRFSASTKLCGIIGKPLEHSLSPAIHNAAAEHRKIEAVFLAFEIDDVKSAIQAMRALSIRMFAVTIPHKEAAMSVVDRIPPRARELGNINTIINDNGALTGYNTDIDGVAASLVGIPFKNRRVVILGAGGAARTVSWYIAKKGGEVYIFNRDKVAGRRLARMCGGMYDTLDDIEKKCARIKPHAIVNATPVGMGAFEGRSLAPLNVLKPGMTVFDVIYNPQETRLMQDARQRGCRVIGGRRMFLLQAAQQFELWSGKPAPIHIMARAFDEALRTHLKI